MKKHAIFSKSRLSERDGATVIIVAIALVMLLGFGAFAVDIGYLYVVRNELQNAADAGALAGAAALYNNDGTAVQPTANVIGQEAAMRNTAVRTAVEVTLNGNSGDVQRGHYSFATGTFTPNASLLPVSLWNVSTEELDANTDFINAVKVTTHRSAPAAPSFFSKIFGYDSFALAAEAVAYIGFAGTLYPLNVDKPIAMCQESLLDAEGNYSCSIGRMINSGSDAGSHNTAAWTNYSQPCKTANANDMAQLLAGCGGSNPTPIILGTGMGTSGGMQNSTYRKSIFSCWIDSLRAGNPLPLVLPVVECPGNNPGPCSKVVGAVEVTVVWITDVINTNKLNYDEVPSMMNTAEKAPWACSVPLTKYSTQAQINQCWNEFASYYNLKNTDNQNAPIAKNSIYLLPSCTPHDPEGGTGGKNFGILAKIPVLVR